MGGARERLFPLTLLPLRCGVELSYFPAGMITDDAGELPGVSIMLPDIDRSIEMTVDIESRS